jgi:uncharacterized membrane protein YadS
MWWQDAVVYQIYPRSFADSTGDGVGDLDGLRARLDHLQWLGVDAVWLSPFYPSPMADFGYDVADYCDVDPLFGTLAVFAYPILGHALGLTDPAFGTWAGTAVNDTSQVVATGFAYSVAAGNVATVVKLTRNTLMGVVILVMGLAFASTGKTQAGSLGQRLRQSVPIFVLGFLGMCALNSVGAVAGLSHILGRDLVADAQFAAKLLILIALAGVGVGTRLSAMRTIGLRPFALGLFTALVASGTSLVLIRLFGPAAAP